MGKFKIAYDTGIEGLKVIENARFGDSRGYFMESYQKKDFEELGILDEFVQDNQSYSKKGVIRGLHFQNGEHSQSKLVRVVKGQVYDVAVDLREGSPTYGKGYGVLLTEDNNLQFYIPENFAHGFLVLSDDAIFCYKVNKFYQPGDEGGLIWNDPDVNLSWPLDEVGGIDNLIFSEKDTKWPTLKELKNNK